MARRRCILALALSLPLAGCGSGDDEASELTGTYRMEVSGEVTGSEGDGEALPETIALEWPGSLEVRLYAYGGEERELCTQGACWYGNATVTVNGSFPATAVIDVQGDGAELGLVMEEGFLVSPADPRDCDSFVPSFLGVQLLLDGARSEGSAGGSIECIVTGDDGAVLHQYAADVQLTMSGMRLPDPDA